MHSQKNANFAGTMETNAFFYIGDLLIYILKGVIIGIVASAPMGPVGILCIRRTIKKGRAYGIATGMGAALSDLFYAVITGLGLSLFDFVKVEENAFWMKLCGCVMLCVFGIYMFRTKPRSKLHPESNKKGSLLRNFFTALIVTLCNPLIIFLFLALFNMLAPFAGTGNRIESFAGYGAIVVGAMLWWIGLTYIINKMRNSFGEKGIVTMNRAIGVIVLSFSFVYALLTLLRVSIIGP